MPSGRSRWIVTLRKELAFQRRHGGRALRLVLVTGLALSGLSAALMWKSQWTEIHAQLDQQLHTDMGLIDLRVNQHRTTVLDWGHWDSMVDFSTGKDPGFLDRELSPSSIISDRQALIIVDRSGRWLSVTPADALSPTVRSCIEARISRLRGLTSGAPDDKAFGLLCKSGEQVVIGAGTGIRPSKARRPESGWLVHVSTMERPSYNQDLNLAFRKMSQSIELKGREQNGYHAHTMRSISDLQPSGQHYVLRTHQSNWQTARQAAEAMLPSWLALNGLLVALLGLGLMTARQRRLPGRIREIQEQRSGRVLSRRLGALLLNRRQLLLWVAENQPGEGQAWLAALRLWCVREEPAGPGQARQQQKLLHLLALSLEQGLRPVVMGLMDERTIALCFPAAATDSSETVRQQLASLLRDTRALLPNGIGLRYCGALAKAQQDSIAMQLIDLSDALASLGADQVSLLNQPSTAANPRPASEAVDGDTVSQEWIRGLADGCYTLSRVWQTSAAGSHSTYQELVFRPSHPGGATEPASHGPIPLQLSSPGSATLLDGYMLRQAMLWLQRPDSGDESCAIDISGETFGSEQHVQALLDVLNTQPLAIRRRLILEVSEASLSMNSDRCRQHAEALQQQGIRLCIDDFGNGTTPIQIIFGLQPSVLKLSADFGSRLHEPNTESMVDFLIAYCRYKHCLLVMQGVDSEGSRRYWMRHGLAALQGAAANPEPTAAAMPL